MNIKFKRGATFSLSGTDKLAAGTWTGSCQLRTPTGSLVQDLQVSVVPLEEPTEDATHSVLIWTDEDTSTWPLGQLFGDVLYVDNSVPPNRDPSDTFIVTVVDRVTHG